MTPFPKGGLFYYGAFLVCLHVFVQSLSEKQSHVTKWIEDISLYALV